MSTDTPQFLRSSLLPVIQLIALSIIAPVSAKSQLANDPCQAYADVKGWIFSFSMQVNGISIANGETKYVVRQSAKVGASIDKVRTESTARGPDGEVIEAVFEAHSTSNVNVANQIYYLDVPPRWVLSGTVNASGGNSAAYDNDPNIFITFQPGLGGTCSSIVNLIDAVDATLSSLDNKVWRSIVAPFSWDTVGYFQSGQPSILGGDGVSILDWLPGNNDPSSTPPPISRTLAVTQPYGGGDPLTWTFQWSLEPIPGCGGGKPVITGPSEVWWFRGQSPPNYDTEITLRATPPSGCEHEWIIEQGDTLAAFKNPSTGPEIELVSLAASGKESDVSIRVRRNGILSDPFAITVRTPRSLDMLAPSINLTSDKYGYITVMNFLILDQFEKRLTKDVPVSELWTSDVAADTSPFSTVSPSWFDRPPAKGGIAFSGIVEENVSGALVSNSNPAPLWRALSDAHKDKVVHWGRLVTVGSQTPGVGAPVEQDTVQLFQDHAEILDLKPAIP